MLVAVMILGLTLNAGPAAQEAEPEPHTLYQQAVGCAASAATAREAVQGEAAGLDMEIFTWGLVMAEYGRRIGRTAEEVDHADLDRALPFFAQMKTARPAVFDAHRAYCRAFLP